MINAALLLLAGSVNAGLIPGDFSALALRDAAVAGNEKHYIEARATTTSLGTTTTASTTTTTTTALVAPTCNVGSTTDDGKSGCSHSHLLIGSTYYKNYCPGYIGGPQLGAGRYDTYANCLTDCNNSPVCWTVLYTSASCGFYGTGYTPSQGSFILAGVFVAQKLNITSSPCQSTTTTTTTTTSASSSATVCSAGTQTINGRVCNLLCNSDRSGGDYSSTPAGSLQACAQACAADSQCSTAQFLESNGYCYLKNARNALVSNTGVDTVDCAPIAGSTTTTTTASSAPTCSAATSTLSGRTCKTQCNTDRTGGDYSSVQAGSVSACAQACAADSKCQTAQYSEANGFCYLKSVRNAQASATGVDTIDCDPLGGTTTTVTTTTTATTPSCAATSSIVNNRQCTVSCGMDRQGGNYAQQQTGTLAACTQACAADSKCVSAQFLTTNGYCYLKSVSNPLVANSNVQTVDCGPTLPLNYGCTTVGGYSKGTLQPAQWVAVTPQLTDLTTWFSQTPLQQLGYSSWTYAWNSNTYSACAAIKACSDVCAQYNLLSFDIHLFAAAQVWQCIVYTDVPNHNISSYMVPNSGQPYAYGYQAMCNQADGTLGTRCFS